MSIEGQDYHDTPALCRSPSKLQKSAAPSVQLEDLDGVIGLIDLLNLPSTSTTPEPATLAEDLAVSCARAAAVSNIS
jgi:hypothetical protein